jgi:hypothetical protein
MVEEKVPPSRAALREALGLSEEILRNIELSEIPLANIALKTSRLARLLNDDEQQLTMQYEVSGYPTTPNGVRLDIYSLAAKAGRETEERDEKTKTTKKSIYLTSISQLEQVVKQADAALSAARDPDVAVSSANPNAYVSAPIGNTLERNGIRSAAIAAQARLSSRQAHIHTYVMRRYHELRFSGIADDIFSRIREKVDSQIGGKIPKAASKLVAVYENLNSENTEDWSNAVHSCRRILQDLADAIYPPRDDVTVTDGGKSKLVKLGPDNYVNRIIAYIQERADSGRFQHIVGSHLSFLGERLDSLFQAAQKGSHAEILARDEADRYVVYTYLLVGDVLSL